MIKIGIDINNKQTCRKRRENKQCFLSPSKNKEIEIKILDLHEKLAIWKNSEHELQNKLDIENQVLSNIQQNIRSNRKMMKITLLISTLSIKKTMKLIWTNS